MSFWRKEEPELAEVSPGRFQVVKGGLWVPQRQWWDLNTFIRLLVAGYGAGKSELLCKWIIASALHNAPVWSSIVSPSFPQARRTIIPTLTRLLEGKASVRQDFTFTHNKGDHLFTMMLEGHPPATVMYQSGDNPDGLKGPNLGTVAIDEPFIQDYKVFEVMVSRCRDPMAKLLAMGMAGTPEELNWGYELAEGDLRGRYDVGYLSAETSSNRVLGREYVQRLLSGYDPKVADAYVRGKFVSLSKGRVFYAFDRGENVKVLAPAGATHFCGMDFNVNPMAFVIGWHANGRCHIYAEYELPNSDTEFAASLIREKHPEVRLVFPDPTGKRRQTNSPGGMSDFKWLGKAGLIVMAPNEPWPRRDSINSVNAKLHSRELTVDPSCKKLIRYMTEHSYENANKQESMTHLLDATRYPVTFLYPAWRGSSASVEMSA